ncbi:hypothetical protein AGABI2DRAFT_180246 [Agaricus bisporus var. bisporus H97]|uniref:hypothetical protein n=1 Tax=Agaricus bisporus var. bisporus (strain H97 / ATCC MYA-4626 / FGSC 10389) TaxID=936046 RepID=UPI00029F57A5|nr:hypothetical protein AGABI2DRAFT_180246 [Agaricus bisporus var. bisporus H97]EKV43761.1 hypothetical protein AGABI2DRAFT_180246 [Agaricus bisporus var. bisporus H97]
MAQSSHEASPSGQPILRKGKACANCRRRKMKCDGVRPVCGPCAKSDKAEDCEYTSGSEQSTSQKLEDKIQRLQTRLQDLQTPSSDNPTLTLQQPYVYRSAPASRPLTPEYKEPPQHVKLILTETFLAYACQYGFFLHPERFRISVLYPGPVGHELRPSPCLLFVTYLLGIHFSQDPDLKRQEKTYLDLTIQQLPHDTTSTTIQPRYRLQIIQAEVLLSSYFFANKRPLEGGYHANSAYSLGAASGIQDMRCQNKLPPVFDDVEEGERVNACWAIFTLDRGWAGVLGYNSNTTCTIGGTVVLTTPMPREIEEYASGKYQCEQREGYTIKSFVTGRESRGESPSSRTVLAKSTFLFEKARSLIRVSFPELPDDQRPEYMDQYSRFRTLALTFKSTLPPLDMWLRTQSIDFIRTAYVGITLLEAALINFHAIAIRQGDEKAHQLSLISAHEIFTNSINLASASWNFGFLNPIIAFAWRTAFNVLFQELNSRPSSSSSSARQSCSEDPLHRQLRKGVASFANYSHCCSYINSEVRGMMHLFHGTPS